jgi:hypothetical protein
MELNVPENVYLFGFHSCEVCEKASPCQHEVQAFEALIVQGSESLGLNRPGSHSKVYKANAPGVFAVCHSPIVNK